MNDFLVFNSYIISCFKTKLRQDVLLKIIETPIVLKIHWAKDWKAI